MFDAAHTTAMEIPESFIFPPGDCIIALSFASKLFAILPRLDAAAR
jgi:hypothetical protein